MFKCQQCGKTRKNPFKRVVQGKEVCKFCFYDLMEKNMKRPLKRCREDFSARLRKSKKKCLEIKICRKEKL